MSLTKLIKAPIKLFKKDVITFLFIRRHDVGCADEKLRYIAVKPSASISVLRHKVWHLLDLPDYCEETIVLKSTDGTELPLTALRKGNDPQHPYILEVWMPDNGLKLRPNMLSLGNGESLVVSTTTQNVDNKAFDKVYGNRDGDIADTTESKVDSIELKNLKFSNNRCFNLLNTDYKKSDITCRISSTSIFRLSGRKNRDSFTNILIKIQSDLCNLATKLSNLENRIPT